MGSESSKVSSDRGLFGLSKKINAPLCLLGALFFIALGVNGFLDNQELADHGKQAHAEVVSVTYNSKSLQRYEAEVRFVTVNNQTAKAHVAVPVSLFEQIQQTHTAADLPIRYLPESPDIAVMEGGKKDTWPCYVAALLLIAFSVVEYRRHWQR